jgi:excisionase family DNA binding protein
MAGEGVQVFMLLDSVLTEMITCKQAAYRYNFHVRTIQKWVDEGKLIAINFERRWWIPLAEIEAFVLTHDLEPV